MAARIVLFLLGIGFAGGGAYLGWREQRLVGALFPPDAGTSPWLLVAALALLCTGLVLAGAALTPRRARAAQLAAETAQRDEAIARADAFYAERARAAERDWRSGDIAPPVEQRPVAPQPVAPPPVAQQPVVQPPVAQPPAPAPSRPAAPEPVRPQAINTPEPAPAASADLDSLAEIRRAIDENRLDEADAKLNAERERLAALGAAGQKALAELTSIAGDHAAAAGRPGHAKWLWRLALRRFSETGAMSGAAAQAVSERLRRIDQ